MDVTSEIGSQQILIQFLEVYSITSKTPGFKVEMTTKNAKLYLLVSCAKIPEKMSSEITLCSEPMLCGRYKYGF